MTCLKTLLQLSLVVWTRIVCRYERCDFVETESLLIKLVSY